MTTAGSWLEVDPDEARRLLGGVERLGRDRGDRFAVVVRLADGDDRAVAELRSEPRASAGAGRRP